MSFTLTGSVITQTGTDTSLSGLNGISGVTVTGDANGKLIYRLSALRLVVDGSLIIDPDYECLVFEADCTTLPNLTYNGTLQIGRKTVTSGRIRYSSGDAIIGNYMAAGDGITNGSFLAVAADGSSFIWYGGRVSAPATMSVLANNTGSAGRTGSILIENGEWFARKATSNAGMFRIGGAANQPINISGLTLDSDTTVAFSTARAVVQFFQNLTNFSVNFKSSSITLFATSPDSVFLNCNFSTNYREIDYIGGVQAATVPISTFRNSDVGTALRVGPNPAQNGRGSILFEENLTVTVADISNTPITANCFVWLKETDDGNRFEPYNRTGLGWTTVQTYNQSVNGSGVAATTVRTGIARVELSNSSKSYFGKTSADDFDIFTVSYLYNIVKTAHILRGNNGYAYTQTVTQDLSITETNKITVDAYTTIENTPKFYDRAKSWLFSNYSGQSQSIVTRSGSLINAGAYNVIIDPSAANAFSVAGNTITLKASTYTGDITTTGLITLQPGVTFLGQRTDANGTILAPRTATITNIVAGSRIQIYNVTTSTEVVNQVVAGTSYSALYLEGSGYSQNDLIRVRATYTTGTSGKLPFVAQAVATNTGWVILAAQEDDAVYNFFGISGGTVTEFSADYPNVQVDISDPDGVTRIDRLYSWFVYIQTTADGIRNWFKGITADDSDNFKINTASINLKIDNVSSMGVSFTDGRRLYRDDGASPLVSSTSGGGSIVMYAGKVNTAAIPTSSDNASATVAALNQTAIPVNITKVNNYQITGQGTESSPWGPV